MDTIVERIITLVENSGFTAKQILEESELSKSSISDWKSGKAKPSTAAVIKLSKFFNVSTDYLLTGDQTHSATALTAEEQEWINLLRHIPPAERKECIGFVKGYITAQNYKNYEEGQVEVLGK